MGNQPWPIAVSNIEQLLVSAPLALPRHSRDLLITGRDVTCPKAQVGISVLTLDLLSHPATWSCFPMDMQLLDSRPAARRAAGDSPLGVIQIACLSSGELRDLS